MATFVRHEPCPDCGSRNNLGRYDDGSAWCFGCTYWEPPKHAPRTHKVQRKADSLLPPEDAGTEFAEIAVEWLGRYSISIPEAIQQNIRWSPSRKQLVFMLEDDCWQARNFSEGKTKYFTAGNVNDSIKVYRHNCRQCDGRDNPEIERTLTVVEDCISAIRVSKYHDAMPVLGSHIANQKLYRLSKLYEHLIIWLDHDKLTEARKIASRANMLGMTTNVIYTELDPKCYSDKEIQEFLNE